MQKKRVLTAAGLLAGLAALLLVLTLLSESTGMQMFRLVRTWNQLNRQEEIYADLNLSAECGPLQFSQQMDFYQNRTEEPIISALRKNQLIVYFTDRAVCDENGRILSEAEATETSEVNSSALLGIAYELCRSGHAEIKRDSYVFTIDEQGMQAIAAAIAPETQELDLTYESGTVRVELEDGALKRIDFAIAGTVPIWFMRADAAISASFVFAAGTGDFAIPDAVRSTLSE